MADDQSPSASQPMPAMNPDDLVSKDLFELIGMQDMPEDQKDQIRVSVLETIRDRTLLRIADALSPEDFEAYKQLLSEPESPETNTKIDDFLTAKDINVNSLTVEETILAKAEAVQAVQELAKVKNG
ncbi:MAG: hypothetical protein AAB701_00275 [Patescibacteria group bacterium]